MISKINKQKNEMNDNNNINTSIIICQQTLVLKSLETGSLYQLEGSEGSNDWLLAYSSKNLLLFATSFHRSELTLLDY